MYCSRVKSINSKPETESLVLEFLETASTLECKLDRELSYTKGVSFCEYRLLKTLYELNAGGLPRIDLAKAVRLTASAVTCALKPLEKIGLVTSKRSEGDARQSLVAITPAGRELLEDARAILLDTLRGLPANTLSDQKTAEFKARLNKMKVR
jgi:DNA-binding MarR family transcriptional regulator